MVERVQKWSHRHPRISSSTTIGTLAAILILTLGLFLFDRSQKLAQSTAEKEHSAFRAEVKDARMALLAPQEDSALRDEGRKTALSALDRFGVLNSEQFSWRNKGPARHLSEPAKNCLSEEFAELYFLLAATSSGEEAWKYHERAMACFEQSRVPRPLWQQRANLLRREGKVDEAASSRELAEKTEVRNSHERYLSALDLIGTGEHTKALSELRSVVDEDPQNAVAWYLLGNCYLTGLAKANDTTRDIDAVGAYSSALALRPKYTSAFYNRGLAYLRLKQFERAEADFSKVLDVRPGMGAALMWRAVAREGLKKDHEALQDVNEALATNATSVRALSIRARIHKTLGNLNNSQADRLAVLRSEPRDEESWIIRGVMKLTEDAKGVSDPKGALADFQEATNLRPQSLAGWQNQAHVLSEHLGKTREAIAALDKAAKINPQDLGVRSSKGVLLARLGQYREALSLAREVVKQTSSAEIRYQVAGIYALCSPESRDHKSEAFRLLKLALRAGYGHELLDKDSDLKALHEDGRWRTLLRGKDALVEK